MPKTTTNAALPEPPAAAVAADAHWALKLAKLRTRQLAEVPVRLWDDVNVRQAFEAIRERAANAALMAAADPEDESRRIVAEAAAAELEDATTGADRFSTLLTFRALPGEAFADLIKAHPPTPEEAERDSTAEWNDKTFPPALIAAASVDGITEEQAAEFLATWGHTDRLALWEGAWSSQITRRADVGKG
ncbi:hypothetical protein [Kitasatospora sp. NPDC058478]|uniref:hypothetical protein n=1 Tax=unclassified Kitasatospora TaxID=2633591 RepID=UPI003650B427